VRKRITISQLFFVGLLSSAALLCAQAQVAGTGGSSSAQPPTPPVRSQAVVQPQGSRPAPQVLMVVHRLSGMKVLGLLHRGGQSPKVIGDEFLTAGDMLTNVTAGFALGDGKSVIARLPQAQAEVEFNYNWQQATPSPMPFVQGAAPAAPATPSVPPSTFNFNYQSLPELQVIQRDGKLRAASYVGLDAVTGLSLIQLEGLDSAPQRDAAEEKLSAGQRVRLLAPTAAGPAPNSEPGKLYLAVGELEGKITELKRSATGKLSRLLIRAPKLTRAYAGGIALNEAGETIGIIETSETEEARVMPMALVRRAAQRVLDRCGNVPKPWLGVRGQAVASTPLAQFRARGWSEEDAARLLSRQYGILLTAVAPNTPAAAANLRSGDVILKFNEDVVKSVEDFSNMLNEVGSNATVKFTVLRGSQPQAMRPNAASSASTPTPAAAPRRFELFKPVEVSVKLSESLNSTLWTWEEATRPRAFSTDPLASAGIESIPLTAKAAARLGAVGGRLVVYVGHESAASRAGLRVFDIIESVNGKPLSSSNPGTFFATDTGQLKSLVVVREGKKLALSFRTEGTIKE
jgi:S1-C subfamily serine protease